MKKILITGGTVFVSRYIAEYYVKQGHEVYVLNRNMREQSEGVKLIQADRHELGDMLKGYHFDIVIDTAYTANDVNLLLDALGGYEDYVLISSSAVYPETNTQPFSEEQECGKNSVWGDYGLNKLKAEQYLFSNVKNAYILRPPYFYGVYENLYREGFPFDCALDDRTFYIPQNGDMKLQFFNVADLCRFIEILIEKHPTNRIFNVGNEDVITVKEWVKLCYKVAGKAPEFISVDKSVSQRDYFCFYDYEYVLDVSKMRELMSDTIPLEQGLKEEFLWYKENPDSVYFKKPYTEYIDENLVK